MLREIGKQLTMKQKRWVNSKPTDLLGWGRFVSAGNIRLHNESMSLQSYRMTGRCLVILSIG
jgi:hypothetical protein